MRLSLVVLVMLLGGCASAPPATPTAGAGDLARQKAEVAAALDPLTAEMKAREARLEAHAGSLAGSERDQQYDALVDAHEVAERGVLEPLAARGNADAMHRLAIRLRDSSAPGDIRRWLSLETTASDLGHPAAYDELVRWYWHQKGDGTIEDVQRNRKVALEYAGKAAAAGYMYSIDRIATYVAGNAHQYPANLEIARQVMELCARTGYRPCAESLALKAPYDFRVSAEEEYLWLSRLARRSPERFARRLDLTWSSLEPAAQAAVRQSEKVWRPASWTELDREWAEIKKLILAHGARSVGPDTPCTTMTPWCRGELIGR